MEKDKSTIENTLIKNITSDNESSLAAGIKLFFPYATHWKAEPGQKNTTSIVERYNGTLRAMIDNYFSAYNTQKWVDVLDHLVHNYNSNPHSAFTDPPKAPNDVNDYDVAKMRIKARERGKPAMIEYATYKIGDRVRILLKSSNFEKAPTKYSKQIYKVTQLKGLSIILKDQNDKILKRRFKVHEISHVKSIDPLSQKTPTNKPVDIPPLDNLKSQDSDMNFNVETEEPKDKIIEPVEMPLEDIKKLNKFTRKQQREGIAPVNDDGEYVHKSRLLPEREKRISKPIYPVKVVKKVAKK
jgi:ribosomal protein L21E